jgi:hypothetical protein
VVGKEVGAEIAGRIPPHGVNVIGVVLRVVVLDQESRALETVVVRAAWLVTAGPGEVDRFEGVAA